MSFNNNLSLASKPPDKSFIDTMVDNATIIGEDSLPVHVGFSDRARAAASDPVATILEYKNLINNLLKILIGIAQNSNNETHCSVRPFLHSWHIVHGWSG